MFGATFSSGPSSRASDAPVPLRSEKLSRIPYFGIRHRHGLVSYATPDKSPLEFFAMRYRVTRAGGQKPGGRCNRGYPLP